MPQLLTGLQSMGPAYSQPEVNRSLTPIASDKNSGMHMVWVSGLPHQLLLSVVQSHLCYRAKICMKDREFPMPRKIVLLNA